MGRKPEVLPSISFWEARHTWAERIGKAKLSVWTGQRKVDVGKHRKEERAEGKTVTPKPTMGFPVSREA